MKTRYSLVFTALFFVFGVHLLKAVDRHHQIKTYGFSIRCISLTEQSGETVTDIDGHVYQIKKIGQQWWMTENLNVSRYRNGDIILKDLNDQQWHDADYGAFAVYPHEYVAGLHSANQVIAAYGKLYNWYVVDDPRGVCPSGWHVPSDEEFKQLEMHLGMTREEAERFTWRGTDQGKQMKSVRMAPDPHPRWAWPNTGATNTSGFSGLPGGARHPDGWYYGLEQYGYWWTSTKNFTIYAFYRRLDHRLEPEPPTLVYPRGAVTGMGTATRFRWYPDGQADIHHNQLHLTDNNGFVLDVDKLKENEYVVFNLKNYTEYSWKVRSTNYYGIGKWSETRTFITVDPPRIRETNQVSAGNNQTVVFEESGLKVTANVQRPGNLTVEVYDHPPFAAPFPGGFPQGFSQTDQSYIYISDDGMSFTNGVLHIPPELLPENVTPDNLDPGKMTILTRPASGDKWGNKGGKFVDGFYVNSVGFDKPGEFSLGLTPDGPFIRYSVSIANVYNGVANPGGTVAVTYGHDIVIAVNPEPGYRIAYIRLDGEEIDLESDAAWDAVSGTLTLSNITRDHQVEVGFELISYTLAFLVTDAATGVEIPDATIKLEDSWHEAGTYVFAQMVPGTYDYLVSRAGYFDKGGAAGVSDDDLTEAVELEVDDTGLSNADMSRLTIYPNPATEDIWIYFGNRMSEHVLLRIYTIQGQTVFQKALELPGEEALHVNIRNFTPGIYLLTLRSKDGLYVEKLFIR